MIGEGVPFPTTPVGYLSLVEGARGANDQFGACAKWTSRSGCPGISLRAEGCAPGTSRFVGPGNLVTESSARATVMGRRPTV